MTSLSKNHERVWKELAEGKNVLVVYTLATSTQDVYNRSRALVESLRLCGFLAETSLDIQMSNGTWLYLRRNIAAMHLSFDKLNATLITFDE